MRYKIISGQGISTRSDELFFVARVNEAIAKGWAPLGGVSMIRGIESWDTKYAQAMITNNMSPDDEG
jgi:hypothetical protein